ncbi:MAG: type II methionyl aminopeptidase, partial [Candidatus Hydrothermarchaeales archaeon]
MDDLYVKAGIIASEVMEAGLEKIDSGVKLLDVAEFIEKLTVEKGAKPAFPCNISINERAAHYTPVADDKTVFKDGDIVKLDIGMHVEGHIADIARSVLVNGKKNDLIKASEKALEEAIKMIKPGVKTNELGAQIEETIKKAGFLPISNLTGHKLAIYNLHGGLVIPNVKTTHADTIQENDVLAIEPFATDGAGRVVDENDALIFKYLSDRPLRMKESRVILNYAKSNYGNLPFAERWISDLVPKFKLNHALRQLAYSKAIYA